MIHGSRLQPLNLLWLPVIKLHSREGKKTFLIDDSILERVQFNDPVTLIQLHKYQRMRKRLQPAAIQIYNKRYKSSTTIIKSPLLTTVCTVILLLSNSLFTVISNQTLQCIIVYV